MVSKILKRGKNNEGSTNVKYESLHNSSITLLVCNVALIVLLVIDELTWDTSYNQEKQYRVGQ